MQAASLLVLVPALVACAQAAPATPSGPNIGFQRRWKTKLQNFPMACVPTSILV